MKKLVMTTMLLVLVLVTVTAAPVLGEVPVNAMGRVTVAETGPYPYSTGDLVLNTDGSTAGYWQWAVFSFINHDVRFYCKNVSSLTFPDEKTAIFTGTFTCCDLPLIFFCSEGASCELTFVVTEGTKDPNYNPGRLLVALPLEAHLPLGFDYGMGRGKMLVYSQDGILLTNHDGDYQVDVYQH